MNKEDLILSGINDIKSEQTIHRELLGKVLVRLGRHEERLLDLEQDSDENRADHKKIIWKVVAALTGVITTLSAAIGSVVWAMIN